MSFGSRTLGYLADPFTPVTSPYTTNGSFTETIPTGATTVVIEVFGASGDGGGGAGSGCTAKTGGGGGSGAYSKTTFSVASLNGKTFDLVVANRNTASNTTVSAGATNGVTGFTQMIAPYGGNGVTAGAGNGAGGAAATTATGGTDTNSVGTAGLGGGNACSPGQGAAGTAGTNGSGGPGGNGGTGTANASRTNGQPGRVYFRYT